MLAQITAFGLGSIWQPGCFIQAPRLSPKKQTSGGINRAGCLLPIFEIAESFKTA